MKELTKSSQTLCNTLSLLPHAVSADVWVGLSPEESYYVDPHPGNSVPFSSSQAPAEVLICCSEPNPFIHKGSREKLQLRWEYCWNATTPTSGRCYIKRRWDLGNLQHLKSRLTKKQLLSQLKIDEVKLEGYSKGEPGCQVKAYW